MYKCSVLRLCILNHVSPSAVSPTSSYTVTQRHSDTRSSTSPGPEHSSVPATRLIATYPLPSFSGSLFLPIHDSCRPTLARPHRQPKSKLHHKNTETFLRVCHLQLAAPILLWSMWCRVPFMQSIKPRTLILFAGMNRTGAVYKWSNLLTVSNIHYLHWQAAILSCYLLA